jgi:hypothetical protein
MEVGCEISRAYASPKATDPHLLEGIFALIGPESVPKKSDVYRCQGPKYYEVQPWAVPQHYTRKLYLPCILPLTLRSSPHTSPYRKKPHEIQRKGMPLVP